MYDLAALKKAVASFVAIAAEKLLYLFQEGDTKTTLSCRLGVAYPVVRSPSATSLTPGISGLVTAQQGFRGGNQETPDRNGRREKPHRGLPGAFQKTREEITQHRFILRVCDGLCLTGPLATPSDGGGPGLMETIAGTFWCGFGIGLRGHASRMVTYMKVRASVTLVDKVHAFLKAKVSGKKATKPKPRLSQG